MGTGQGEVIRALLGPPSPPTTLCKKSLAPWRDKVSNPSTSYDHGNVNVNKPCDIALEYFYNPTYFHKRKSSYLRLFKFSLQVSIHSSLHFYCGYQMSMGLTSYRAFYLSFTCPSSTNPMNAIILQFED